MIHWLDGVYKSKYVRSCGLQQNHYEYFIYIIDFTLCKKFNVLTTFTYLLFIISSSHWKTCFRQSRYLHKLRIYRKTSKTMKFCLLGPSSHATLVVSLLHML